ncbi:MAG TPA: Xaa-Pro peptidase family protein [Mycobacteriales bacterium]|nr:Xaa-Pro peptidase family protein [Mycobacteriales bacterium]
MPENHAARRDKLRRIAAERDLDAVLITSLVNVRYLSGFTGSNGAILISATGTDTLATDGRYTIQAAAQAPDVERINERAVARALAERAAERGWTRLGFESHIMTVDDRDDLAADLPALQLSSIERVVEELRAVKDEQEIATLARACRIADEALAALLEAGGIRAGRSEREIGLDLDRRMLELGADAVSFETIVAAGANSAIPHHRPGPAAVAPGDFVKIDFGAEYDGYHSDMTRTFVLGEPAGWQREIYDLVAAAQRAGSEAVQVGADVVAVDQAARAVIDAAGHKDHFGHGLGHGVGLEIHEAPSLGPRGTGKLAELMPVTVEPGVYLEGQGGVRIEDTLVVRAGGPELLTHTSKDLLVL